VSRPLPLPLHYGTILYRVRDIVTYWSKIAKFLYPPVFRTPAGGDSVGIAWRCLMVIKLEWLGYPTVKKLWQHVEPFSSNTGTSRTDRQTNGRNDLLYQYCPSVCWCVIKTWKQALTHTPDPNSPTRWDFSLTVVLMAAAPMIVVSQCKIKHKTYHAE